jgi:signal transduction histidine kinase
MTSPARAAETTGVPAAPAPASADRARSSWISRLLPQSLFGRLVAVLAGGLLVAQLLSAAINLAERESLLVTSGGMQQAQRIADVVQLLESMDSAERERIVAVLNVPPLVLSLHDAPAPVAAATGEAARTARPARMYLAMLQRLLGEGRDLRVDLATAEAPAAPRGRGPGRGAGPGMPGGPGAMGQGMMRGGMMGPGHGWAQGTVVLRTQVRLIDGRWARFDGAAPAAPQGVPWRLVIQLGVLLVAVLVLSYLAVRWVTRPLHLLATAADELGRNLHRPPLPETGPLEIRRAAHAFNTMQSRLARYVDDRTRILAAMSHDLKTPLTRMRLRAELLDDDEARERFEADLAEMQAMVQQTLDFMRGLGGGESPRPLDVDALVAAVQAGQQAMGRDVSVSGRTREPFTGVESLLKRCLGNLVDNAVLYGGRAEVVVEDGSDALTLRVRDPGPGIPEDQLEQVFEPFYRLEGSRNRATGGTGLGLTIARNIAQTHGGDIELRNRAEGGLEAVLRLPRAPAQRRA